MHTVGGELPHELDTGRPAIAGKRPVPLAAQRDRVVAKMEAPGLSDAACTELQAEVDALTTQITAQEEQQAKNVKKIAEPEEQLRWKRARHARGEVAQTTTNDPVNNQKQAEAEECARAVKEFLEGGALLVGCLFGVAGGPTGKTYKPTVSGLDMRFVGLSAGEFCMGNPEGVGEDDEHPQQPVNVPGFMLGRPEVTQAQWKAVDKAAKAANNVDAARLDPVPSGFNGDKLPVENVSCCDVTRFATVLLRLEGRTPA